MRYRNVLLTLFILVSPVNLYAEGDRDTSPQSGINSGEVANALAEALQIVPRGQNDPANSAAALALRGIGYGKDNRWDLTSPLSPEALASVLVQALSDDSQRRGSANLQDPIGVLEQRGIFLPSNGNTEGVVSIIEESQALFRTLVSVSVPDVVVPLVLGDGQKIEQGLGFRGQPETIDVSNQNQEIVNVNTVAAAVAADIAEAIVEDQAPEEESEPTTEEIADQNKDKPTQELVEQVTPPQPEDTPLPETVTREDTVPPVEDVCTQTTAQSAISVVTC